MEDIETIILNSFSEEPIYYVVTADKPYYDDAIIQANYNEDCVALIEKMVIKVANAEKVIDIDFSDGDDETYATFDITYMKNGVEEIVNFSFVVVQMIK